MPGNPGTTVTASGGSKFGNIMRGIGKVASSFLPALGPLGTVASGVMNMFQAKRERKFQKQMALDAHQRDVEMWERSNAYNAPQQQMERLKQAGLNPNLVYGSGSVSGNTSGQIPKFQSHGTPVHRFNPMGAMNMLSAYQEIKSKQLSNDRMAMTNYILSRTADDEIRTKSAKHWDSWFTKQMKGELWRTGTYLGQQQESLKGQQLRNALLQFEKEFIQTVPKEWQWLATLLKGFLR